uniref:PPM-type phosphatase domain-containing protein n=1 Tax=Hemiselmis andersenii TaxID=464988 RepID=A0A6U2DHD6_HEMAN|mmetsp:Transcript_2469/g.5483  ORF Transcript_2469/g.5483 Transcript_2469/m.5483 type:complete len:260 (-) Transcript_2469:96-875(-)|eukprot:CAMPEP_0114140818 /NCGR_PEP_ID=MMETSP0043_2-20121206/17590_1 /TAXON_ID=464988 /ORGANISM="Hemiselmis andersenii, Strain CCMP644" /LENGTH=259 /DNA_ID=CAMNT_0001234943 /DNA_START=124 /DNA_END=903 /DNA_ORIENTATION=+
MSGSNAHFDVGFSEDDNLKWRKSMEDTHVIQVPFLDSAPSGFFAVYDGHGGKEAADIVSCELHHFLREELMNGGNETVRESFFKAYEKTDERLRFDALYMGATAVTCMVRREGGVKKLYAANAGDARAVLCRDGTAVRITRDHKASDSEEQVRVQKSGGWVSMNRVHGVLAVSRALGDHAMKQSVISEPNFWEAELTPADSFLIIACDGLWDVCTDQASVDMVKEGGDAQTMAQTLMQAALDNGGKDNISVMVVRWPSL